MRAFWLFLWLATPAAFLGAAPASSNTEASLILAATEARPGDTVLAGVRLKMKPNWHTYWRNSGDSGTPTSIQWTLPAGVSAGEIQWPVPEKLTVAPFTTYVLHDEAILLVPLALAPDLKAGPVELKAEVSWLECEDLCLPGDATIRASLTIGTETKPGPGAALIESAQQRLPRIAAPGTIPARWAGPPSGEERVLEIEWKGPTGSEPDFFPYASDAYEVMAERIPTAAGLSKKVKKSGPTWPASVPGLLVAMNGKRTAESIEVTLKPDGGGTAGSPPEGPTTPAPAQSLPLMLFFAFIGGLILNIMPCVLPVIALKVLGFVNQSRESPAHVRLLGLAYGAGVLACFLGLALAALAVRQAGGLASWGIVLQNQVARVLLTVVITLVALNLFGVFEVILSGKVTGAAGDLAAREGLSGAFFNGLLAAVLATPCTAPFMGSALAFAFIQPAVVTLLVFFFLGLGLAAPFVALCWQPAWLKWMPRPGAWMERFKVAMGFPMMATAVWLFWFTAPRYGKDGVLYLGLFLVVLATAAWTFGEFVQRGRQRRGLAALVAVSFLASGYYYLLEKQLRWRQPTTALAAAGGSLKHSADGIDWLVWSPEAVAAARAAGRPVLVDFTADNCLNCKLNKVTSLEIGSTRARLKETNTAAFLGDFTDQDPRIAAVLQQHQRAGVPLVLVYPADPQAPPEVLPPVLTPSIVHEALDRAVNRKTAAR